MRPLHEVILENRREESCAHGKVSVLMPAFNESRNIASNLREVVDTFLALNIEFEVILIDDGSPDHTYLFASDVLGDHPELVRVVRYDINQGKGGALITGAAVARGEFIVFLDADMDLHPAQLTTFFEIQRETSADAVIGSKRHPQSKVDYPWMRQIYSWGYYNIVRLLFGLPLRDTQTGLKLFRKRLLDDVFPRVLNKRFAFDIELLAVAHNLGYRLTDAPVRLEFQRVLGRIAWPEVWKIFLDTLAIFYRLRIRHYYDAQHPQEFAAICSTSREYSPAALRSEVLQHTGR